VLVPIGHARLRAHEGSPAVRLRAGCSRTGGDPRVRSRHGGLDDPYERDLLELHGRAYHGERYYAHPVFDHSGLYAGAHPIVRTSPGRPVDHLRPLSELSGYRVARGEPDIRGWAVTGFANAPLGRITDLIVDLREEKVRYAVLATERRQLLLPVGFLTVEAPAGRVTALSLFSDDMHALPGYAGGRWTGAWRTLRAALSSAQGSTPLPAPGLQPRRAQEGEVGGQNSVSPATSVSHDDTPAAATPQLCRRP
jgi:hypothetical protein